MRENGWAFVDRYICPDGITRPGYIRIGAGVPDKYSVLVDSGGFVIGGRKTIGVGTGFEEFEFTPHKDDPNRLLIMTVEQKLDEA